MKTEKEEEKQHNTGGDIPGRRGILGRRNVDRTGVACVPSEAPPHCHYLRLPPRGVFSARRRRGMRQQSRLEKEMRIHQWYSVV